MFADGSQPMTEVWFKSLEGEEIASIDVSEGDDDRVLITTKSGRSLLMKRLPTSTQMTFRSRSMRKASHGQHSG